MFAEKTNQIQAPRMFQNMVSAFGGKINTVEFQASGKIIEKLFPLENQENSNYVFENQGSQSEFDGLNFFP